MRRLILILAILAAFLIFTPFAASQGRLHLDSGHGTAAVTAFGA